MADEMISVDRRSNKVAGVEEGWLGGWTIGIEGEKERGAALREDEKAKKSIWLVLQEKLCAGTTVQACMRTHSRETQPVF